MDEPFKNEEKVMVRISFLTQHIIDKFKYFPYELEQGSDTCFVAKYYDKRSHRQLIVSVDDDLSCYLAVVDRLNDKQILAKEFKEYKCLDEAFQLLRIPTLTSTPNERNQNEIHDNSGPER